MLTEGLSCSFRERSKYHKRAADVGALEPPVPLQFEIQLSGYRVHVRARVLLLSFVGSFTLTRGAATSSLT